MGYRIKNGRFQLFKPRCPTCLRSMSLFGQRGASRDGRTPEAVMSNITMGPQIIWSKITFRCDRHHDQLVDVPGEELIQMAAFQQNQVDFISNDS